MVDLGYFVNSGCANNVPGNNCAGEVQCILLFVRYLWKVG